MNGLGNKEVMSANIKKYMDRNGIDRNKLASDLGQSMQMELKQIKRLYNRKRLKITH